MKLKFLFNLHEFSDEETGVVATCGGNIVCLIDVNTGRILKRFKQDKDGGQVCTMICVCKNRYALRIEL